MGLSRVPEGVNRAPWNERDIPRLHMVQDARDLDIELALEEEERLILSMVNMAPWSDAGLDDVFKDRDGTVGLVARKKNLQRDGAGKH